MFRIITFSILLVLLVNCGTERNKNSQKIPIKYKNIDANSGYEIKKIQLKNIEYSYVLDNKQDTINLWTTDYKFVTKEGFKIGTKFSELPKTLQNSAYKLSGYGYFVKLNSGWTLGFCVGKTCTDNYPDNQSKVAWIKKQII